MIHASRLSEASAWRRTQRIILHRMHEQIEVENTREQSLSIQRTRDLLRVQEMQAILSLPLRKT